VLEELPSFTKQRAQRAVHGRIVEQLTEQRYTEKQPIATKLLASRDYSVGLCRHRAVKREVQAQLVRRHHVQAIHHELLHGGRWQRGGHARRVNAG
jgi:hypothetical protein